MTQDDLWVVPMTMDTSPLGLPGGLEPALGGVHVGGSLSSALLLLLNPQSILSPFHGSSNPSLEKGRGKEEAAAPRGGS